MSAEKKKTAKRIAAAILTAAILFLAARTVLPARTPAIRSENSISELRKVGINGTDLQVMIRGEDRNNPVLIFVHGGPCCSEIPYARKYQKDLEKAFTIVHYDQRGSGKSYVFGKKDPNVTAAAHVEDLICLTEYVEEYLGTDRAILLGHSYGTYIALQAAAKRPDLYSAYVGIGQMSDTVLSETATLEKCIGAALDRGDKKTADELESLRGPIADGERIVPRNIVRKYGFAARRIHENRDYALAFLTGPEYSLIDAVRYYAGASKYQDGLVLEALKDPVSGIVTEISIPVYFVMGKYDGMTSPEAAQAYLARITGEGEREFILFGQSAHYPQLEEKETFARWMEETFG